MRSDALSPLSAGMARVPLPRTVDRCERYLDRLALVVERAGPDGSAFLPIARRLQRELAEAKGEERLLQDLMARRLR